MRGEICFSNQIVILGNKADSLTAATADVAVRSRVFRAGGLYRLSPLLSQLLVISSTIFCCSSVQMNLNDFVEFACHRHATFFADDC